MTYADATQEPAWAQKHRQLTVYALLQKAKPYWSTRDLGRVYAKLQKVSITDIDSLGRAVSEGYLNRVLIAAGERKLKSSTLANLKIAVREPYRSTKREQEEKSLLAVRSCFNGSPSSKLPPILGAEVARGKRLSSLPSIAEREQVPNPSKPGTVSLPRISSDSSLLAQRSMLSEQDSKESQSRQGTVRQRRSLGSSVSQGSLVSLPSASHDFGIGFSVPSMEFSGSCWSVRTVERLDAGVTGASFYSTLSGALFAHSGLHWADENEEESVSSVRFTRPMNATTEGPPPDEAEGSPALRFTRPMDGTTEGPPPDEVEGSLALLPEVSVTTSFTADFEEYSEDAFASTNSYTISSGGEVEKGEVEEADAEEEESDMRGQRGREVEEDEEELRWHANQERRKENSDTKDNSWDSWVVNSEHSEEKEEEERDDQPLRPALHSGIKGVPGTRSKLAELPPPEQDILSRRARKQRRNIIRAYA